MVSKLFKIAEYRAWRHMKNRCYNANEPKFPAYGGRGIRVCDRWLKDYPAFLSDMGPRPGPEYTLDRIEVNGHYEPGNCRWATQKVQQNNRTNTRIVTVRGETMKLTEACERFGVEAKAARGRMRLGWSEDQIFLTQVRADRRTQARRSALGVSGACP